MNYSMMELVWLLLIYSFLGWVVETIVGTVKKKKFVNRGFSTPLGVVPLGVSM